MLKIIKYILYLSILSLIGCSNDLKKDDLAVDFNKKSMVITKNIVKFENPLKNNSKNIFSLKLDNTKNDLIHEDNISLNLNNSNLVLVLKLLLDMHGYQSKFYVDNLPSIDYKILEGKWSKVFNTLIEKYELKVLHKGENVFIYSKSAYSTYLNNIKLTIRNNVEKNNKTTKIKNSEKVLSEPMEFHMFKISYANIEAVESHLLNIFNNNYIDVLVPKIKISKDEKIISMFAKKTQFKTAEKIINLLDKKEPQVFIEAYIVSVGDDFEQKFGAAIRASGETTNSSLNGDNLQETDVLNIPFGLGSKANFSIIDQVGIHNVKLTLDALEEQNVSQKLANPKIITRNNIEASFIQGLQFQVKTTTVGQNGTTTENVEYKDANLQLRVKPTILNDGNVLMTLKLTNDSPDLTTGAITKMEINSELIIENGRVIVIGGIYNSDKSNKESKVPGLGDVPLLGFLFGSQQKVNKKNELLIFLSAKII